MRFEFRLARTGHGPGASWRSMPAYDFSDWRLVRESPQQLVYRPGLRTVLPRAALALIMAVLIALLYAGYRELETRRGTLAQMAAQEHEQALELRETGEALGLSGQEVEQLLARHAQDAAERREAQAARLEVAQSVLAGLMALLGVVGALPLLVCLWNRVRLEADGRGKLSISTWVFWPRTRVLALHIYDQVHFGADEMVDRGRHGGIHSHYWRWFVQLLPATSPAGPVTAVPLTLYPHRQADRPGTQPRPPRRVVNLVEWLLTHKQMQVEGPFIHEERRGGAGAFSTRHSTPVISRRQYSSLEEMPPELRARFEAMRRQMAGASEQYYYQDDSGQTHIYANPEEMPPELREIFERIRDENS